MKDRILPALGFALLSGGLYAVRQLWAHPAQWNMLDALVGFFGGIALAILIIGISPSWKAAVLLLFRARS